MSKTWGDSTSAVWAQVAFVEELHAAGVVDDVERKALLAPIEKRERMLQRRGAVWRTPRVMDVRTPLLTPLVPYPTLCSRWAHRGARAHAASRKRASPAPYSVSVLF